MAPTYIPDDAIYYNSFETGAFLDDPAWSVKSSLKLDWKFEYKSSSMLTKYQTHGDGDVGFRGADAPASGGRFGPPGRQRRRLQGCQAKADTPEWFDETRCGRCPPAANEDPYPCEPGFGLCEGACWPPVGGGGGGRGGDGGGGDSGGDDAEKDNVFWSISKKEAATGVYSLQSPDLTNDAGDPQASSVTFVTDEDWPRGVLSFAALWDTNWPGSDLSWYVDGRYYGWVPEAAVERWETFEIYLEAGRHEVTWEFLYNPKDEDDPPPGGVAFLDDVYFAPKYWSFPPTMFPTMDPTMSPTKDGVFPTVSPTMEFTVSPTFIPAGATYYDSFEQGTFPGDDPEWSVDTSDTDGPALMVAQRAPSRVTSFRDEAGSLRHFHDRVRKRRLQKGDNVMFWARTADEAYTGGHSLISPDLTNSDRRPTFARVSFTTNPEDPSAGVAEGGVLAFHLLWDINYPGSDLVWYVDDDFGGWVLDDYVEDWQRLELYLPAGTRRVTWEFQYNPKNLEDPPTEGVAFLDDISFVPGATLSPSPSPTKSSTSPTASPTASPSLSPTASPTLSPTTSPTTSPTSLPTTSPKTSPPTVTPSPSSTTSPTMSPSFSSRPTVDPESQCPFCPDGMASALLDTVAATCAEINFRAKTVPVASFDCPPIRMAEHVCCPDQIPVVAP